VKEISDRFVKIFRFAFKNLFGEPAEKNKNPTAKPKPTSNRPPNDLTIRPTISK